VSVDKHICVSVYASRHLAGFLIHHRDPMLGRFLFFATTRRISQTLFVFLFFCVFVSKKMEKESP